MYRRPSHQPYAWLPWLIVAVVAIGMAAVVIPIRYLDAHLKEADSLTLSVMATDIADEFDQLLFERFGDIQVMSHTVAAYAPGSEAQTAYLNLIKDTYLHYQRIVVTNTTGRIIAATDPAIVGKNERHTLWFQHAHEDKERNLPNTTLFKEAGQPRMLCYSAPITRSDGEFSGMLAAFISLSELEDIAARIVQTYTAKLQAVSKVEWNIVAQDGTLISDSVLHQEGHVNLLTLGQSSAILASKGKPGIVAEPHGRLPFSVLTGYATTKGYGEFQNPHWNVLVRVDENELLAPITSMKRTLALMGGLALIPTVGLLLWSTHRLRTEWARVLEKHKLLLHSLDAIVWEADPADFRLTYISPQVERILGYSPEQCLSQQVTWQHLIHPEDIEKVVATCQRETMARRSHDLEYRMCRADGRVIWIKDLVTVAVEQARPVRIHGIIVDITKQKMSEQAEAASREQLAAIIGSVVDAIVSVDADQRIVLFNTAAEEIFRCPAADAVGQPLDRFIPQRFHSTHHAQFDALAKSDQPAPLKMIERPVVGLRADGEEFPAHIALSSVKTTNGWRYTAVVRDMTEQMRKDRAQRLQYAVTQILAEATIAQEAITSILKAVSNCLNWAVGAYWRVDAQAQTLQLVECCTVQGSRLEEFERITRQSTWEPGIGLPGWVWSTGQAAWVHDVAQDHTLPRASVAADANLHGAVGVPIILGREIVGIMEFFSVQTVLPDQELLQMLTAIGNQIGIFLERKHAESKAWVLLQAVEASVEGIMLGNPEGIITYANPAAARMFGYEMEELVGRPAHVLSPEDMRAEGFSSILASALETGWSGEVTGLRKDGTHFPRWVSVSPVRNAMGLGQGLVSVTRDLTETKLMEAHAWRLQRLATLGQLLGGIAHEIKNPLFIMTGRLQLLEQKLAQQDYATVGTDLEKIEAAAHRIKTVAERFLSLARPVPPHKESCSVEAILQDVLEFLANELMKSQIRVEREGTQRLPRIMSDPGLLHEVFLNLVFNAMQAMAEAHGQGTLRVVTALVANNEIWEKGKENGGDWIEVRIQDDGPGIAPEHRARLFEPFFSTKPPEKGTGLGLWAVRSILMTLKGTVRYETEVGHGTTFIVRLQVTSEGPHQETES